MFFKQYLTSTLKSAKEGLIKTAANFDPEGVQEAQLAEYKSHVDEIAAMAARSVQQLQAGDAKIATLQSDIERHLKALDALQGSLATADAARQTTLTNAISRETESVNQMMTDLEAAKSDRATLASYVDELKAAHAAAVTKWTTGRRALDQAKAEQDRARLELERATERKESAERAAGLVSDVGGADAGLNAFAANAARMREKAEAMKLTTGAITPAAADDAEIAAALRSVDAAPTSGDAVQDLRARFANLKSK